MIANITVLAMMNDGKAGEGMKEWICQEEPLIRADGASIGVGFRQMIEFVRCKDCKHQNWVNTETGCIVCKFGRGINAPDWYCADGERKS